MDVLNSRYRETNLSITPDGKYLYFMSLRGGQSWSHKYMTFHGDSVYDGDIWYSAKLNGRWQPPTCMPFGINSYEGEDEPNVSPDGRTVYFQSWNTFWQDTGGPYYMTRREGSRWGPKVGMGGGITDFFHYHTATDGMSMSPDEKTFIVAAGLEYDGNMDLYASQKGRLGWSVCQRLPISTPGDERSVFIAADGRTLYFASDGYMGMGGLDIYKVVIDEEGQFGPVINIGKPFNTAADDYGFILTADGNEAYFVRNGDIYFADLKEADMRIKPGAVAVEHLLKGTVRDSGSWRGIPANVMVLDARTKRLVRKVSTRGNGAFEITLPNETRSYDLVVEAEAHHRKRGRVAVEANAYPRTLTRNFILASDRPAAPDPEPDPEPVAETPTPPAEPKAAPLGPVASLPNRTSPPLEVSPIPPSEASQLPEPRISNPYSFDGVAENNLTLLLDVSASMRLPGRLPLLKDALQRMLSHMRPVDRISLITYSGHVQIKLDGVSAAYQEEILHAIENLNTEGSTDGKGALRKAYNLAKDHYISQGNNRIVMATDGAFEVSKLYGLAEKIAEKGMSLTIFSFGKLPDYRIKELEKLAQLGGGNYANINEDNADVALLKEAQAVRQK
jgi:hypothetical protein